MFKERVIAYKPWDKLSDKEKVDIFTEIEKVLSKRRALWLRYSRGIDFETLSTQYSNGTVSAEQTTLDTENGLQINSSKHLSILLEKFIVDIAAGYLSGNTEYDVDSTNDIQSKVRKLVFEQDPITPEEAQELRYIVDTITQNNSDQTELTTLFRDMLLYGCCYERVIDSKKDGYQYYFLDALNTVALWTDDVKPQLMAVVQAFKKQVDNGQKYLYLYRVYLPKSIEVYSREDKTPVADEGILKKEKDKSSLHEWNEVPVVVYESQFSILDKCESLIQAYEILLNNVKDTYKYNAEDCKMKIAGYRPQNPITIPNPEYDPDDEKKKNLPQMVLNPARIIEDNAILAGKTFYVQEGGDADWLIKPVEANDVTKMLKFYVDSIFQLAGIPNTTDLAFNSADLNASAIDRKFYIMNIVTSNLREGMEKLIRKRFKMFLDRINKKHQTKYDVNNIRITINTNLPSMTDENIDQMIRLDGLLSQETILEKLGYDYETELQRKKAEKAELGTETDENGTNNDENETETDENGTNNDKPGTNFEKFGQNKKNAQINAKRNVAKIERGTKVITSPIGHEQRGN